MRPTFFAAPADLRAWFEENHAAADELWVGFHRTATGLPSVTWSEAVDQALCFGWVDGVRKGVDERSYKIRFTRRKARSTWSAVNIAKVGALTEAGLMRPEGVAAYERRTADNSGVYSHEQTDIELGAEREAVFRAAPGAWEFFEAQPPSYRRSLTWWVISAKRPETRERRLAKLIEDCAAGRRVAAFSRP